MTPTQLATLGAAIAADRELNALPNTQDGAYDIAERLNVAASPDFIVWKSLVSITEIGERMDGGEVETLTAGEASRMLMKGRYSMEGVNPSVRDNRTFFDRVFSGDSRAKTRASLSVLWRRKATEGEAIFAVGVGSNADPATMAHEGRINYGDVFAARAL